MDHLKEDHLKDMSLFVEVARSRNFHRAAEALGMPSSTLSRRIAALERSIGLRLFHRTTRNVELTEAGQIYFERSARIVDEARRAHEHLAALIAQPTGVLRVSAPVDFAVVFMAPHLPGFRDRYPGIGLELDLSARRVDLVAEPFDVAIRMGELPSSGLIARKLVEVPRNLYASPSYLASRGAPKDPSDLRGHDCLLFSKEATWTLHQERLAEDCPVRGDIRVNNVGMMKRLALEGLGIAMLARDAVIQELDTGKLARVLPDWEAPPIAVHAVSETRLLPAKALRFVEYLAECLG